MKKCIGCGIKLQNTDNKLNGYTININNDYCERCFKLSNYGINKDVIIDNYDFIIDKINILNYYTIFITDIINLNNKVINFYNSINTNKILVINKIDLLPNNLDILHLKENIEKVYNTNCLLISTKYDINLNYIENIIKDNNNVLICGETSSGKSTLINKLFNTKLTTSKFNNTTLDFIKIDYDKYTIYDTPGFIINNDSYYNNINYKIIQNKSNFDININDLVINIDNNIGVVLFIKDKYNIITKKTINNKEYKYIIDKPSDILIDDVGFIYIKKNCTIYSNKKLCIRDSVVGVK